MPAVSNHDNACWGVKRSFCSVFQYDFEEIQTRKQTEIDIVANSKTVVQNANSINYSVSSNGYYGFQPHNGSEHQTKIDESMDVEDSNTSSIGQSPYRFENNDLCDTNILEPCQFNQNFRRKRRPTNDFTDDSKRMRHEECGDDGATVCRRRQLIKTDRHGAKNDSEIATQLLRHTHGCEIYLHERNCDY